MELHKPVQKHTSNSPLSVVKDYRRYLVLFTLILAGEAIFFLPFVLPRVFRPTLLRVLDVSNLELGVAFSAYGVVAMLSYFFGGFLADRFAPRNLMALALIFTAAGGLVLAGQPGTTLLILVYAFWGVTSILLFWSALIKATRMWGGDHYQGRAFGLLEGGRGLMAAVFAASILLIASMGGGTGSELELSHGDFNRLLVLTSLFVASVALLVWLFIPVKQENEFGPRLQRSGLRLFELLKMPVIWLQAVIVICAYVGYKITDDFSLYANQVLGMTEVEAAAIGGAALWMRPLFAVTVGFIADKFTGSRVLLYCFLLMSLGALLLAMGWAESSLIHLLVAMLATVAGIYGIRGIYFALMGEAAIPLHATGLAVGIISVLGFTPDVFMSPLMGYLLDANPGVAGHRDLFVVLTLFALLGWVASLAFSRQVRRL